MRLVAAVAVWLVLVGGTAGYLRLHDARSAQAQPSASTASPLVSGFTVELTPTFAAAPDPFALQLAGDAVAPALVARLNGVEILRRSDTLTAGEVVVVQDLPPVGEGTNELYIEAAPAGDEALQAHALRARVLQGGRVIAEETLWSEPGGVIAAPVTFEAAVDETSHAH